MEETQKANIHPGRTKVLGWITSRITAPEERKSLAKKYAKLVILVAWLPTAIISAFEGWFYNGTITSFILDPFAQMRLLFALPLMIIGMPMIENNTKLVAEYASKNLLNSSDLQKIWEPAVERARKLVDTPASRIVIIIVVILATLRALFLDAASIIEGDEVRWFGYSTHDQDHLSWAGRYYYLIAMPVFQYVMYRCLWRYLVWIWQMIRLSRAELTLTPIHPDRMGGLGILFQGQFGFILFFIAINGLAAGSITYSMIDTGMTFAAARMDITIWIGTCLVVIFAPMMVFMNDLMQTRKRGLIEYGIVGTNISKTFRRQWVEGQVPAEESDRMNPDVTADFSTTYGITQDMLMFPFTLRNIIMMGVGMFIPYVLVLLQIMSVEQLIEKLLNTVL